MKRRTDQEFYKTMIGWIGENCARDLIGSGGTKYEIVCKLVEKPKDV